MSKTIARVINPKRFSFVSTLESAFGVLGGSLNSNPASLEDRLARRAANDAEQR